MKELFVAVQVEVIKLRRTLAFWMMFLAPLGIVALTVFFNIRLSADVSGADKDAWAVMVRDTLGFWVVLMLPMFVALESSLMAQLEHSQKMWKHLFSLPSQRWTIYLAKLIITMIIVGISTAVLMAGIVLSGWLLQHFGIRPDFNWISPNPTWDVAIRTALLVFILSWCMIALQTYVSMKWSSFIVSLGIGSIGSMMSFILVRSVTLAQVIPWSLPFNALEPYIKQGSSLELPLLVSLAGTFIFTLFGLWDLSTKDII
ncbi:MAG: ABC-2 family transporter protein [Chloroflexi bacterium OLB14]|nr:MAG: ABC-2 family transporter protein [Chloroflexi bacterium OLB14]